MGDQTQMALVDAEHPYDHSAAVRVVCGPPGSETAAALIVRLDPAAETAFDGRVLRLAGVDGDQIGRVRLRAGALEGAEVFDLPDSTEPDPTIAGVVDFVLSEARHAQKRRR
jgi:hypothetical protein